MRIKNKETFVLEFDEIALHKDSVEYLEEVFDCYKDGGFIGDNEVLEPIIHLYAKQDTRNENGDLDGYYDSLFFEAHIYDINNKIKYKTRLHDSIDVADTKLWQVKIFKDGSTIMLFYGKYKFGSTTTLSMFKVAEGNEF
jgi:hypothetical protein